MRICWAQYAFWGVIVALGVMAMLAGCGAKGDLYLPPDEPPGVEQEAPAPLPDDTDANANQGQ
ncbi:MAG: lipoprotein [Gammaproteobacteria bacterium]|nr:lipoprotein [Gammaproteobacteria bacterium]